MKWLSRLRQWFRGYRQVHPQHTPKIPRKVGMPGRTRKERGAGMQLLQLQARGAMQRQQMHMAGASEQQRLQLAGAQRAQALGVSRENLIAQGAQQTDMAIRGGEAMLQEAEMSRQATLLGMQMGQSAGANQSYQQSLYNQQQAGNYANQMMISGLNTLGTVTDWTKPF